MLETSKHYTYSEINVDKYIAPAVLSSIDPFQFGGIPRSSATKALISMVRVWTQATDGTGNAVRVVLFYYKKAFDLIDHKILATKIIQLPMPTFIKRWVIDFLMNRQQRVKLARDCMSWPEMEDIKRSGVRAHVFLIIQCTIQISGSVWQTQKYGCLFLLV